MRYAWLLLLVAAAGCGSVDSRSGEGASESTPQILAVDRPAPGAHRSVSQVSLRIEAASSWDPCAEAPTAENTQACEDITEIHRQVKAEDERRNAQYAEETSPAPGTEPRVVAELALGGETRAELVAWSASSGKTCTLARITPADRADFGVERVGECAQYVPCTELCLGLLSTGDDRFVLAGTVPEHADALRLAGSEGRERAYGLSGPVIEGTDRRVFMADLGNEEWWTMELRRGGETLANDETLGHRLRGFRCASPSVKEFESCYAATPLPPDPALADEPDLEPSCGERQFDEADAGFQTCDDEGDPEESE